MREKDYEISPEYEQVYEELRFMTSGERFKIFEILNNPHENNSEEYRFINLIKKIERLTNIEKTRILELLEGVYSPAKHGLEKSDDDFTSGNEQQAYEEDQLSLEIIEASIKSKIQRVRRIHLDLGEDLERAKSLFHSMGYDDGEETFSDWYTKLGLSPSAVSLATKRYKLYLEYKNHFGDNARAFFENISVRFIKELTKKEVLDSGLQEELLMKIFEGELKVSTEVNQILKDKDLIKPNFSAKKLYMLAGKIDRYKSRIKKDAPEAYNELMLTLVHIDNFCDLYSGKNTWNLKTFNPQEEMVDFASKIKERNLQAEEEKKILDNMNEIKKILKIADKREKNKIIDVIPEEEKAFKRKVKKKGIF